MEAYRHDDVSGEGFVGVLQKRFGKMDASKRMLANGIKGIKYPDAFSRAEEEGATYNYVIFDAADVTVDDVRYSRPKDLDAPPPLENEQSEARLVEAEKGIQENALMTRLSEAWETMRRNFSRHFPLVDKTPENADLIQKMLHLESQSGTAQDRIANIFQRVVGGLTEGQLKTLTRYLVFKDLLWTSEQGMNLPFGLQGIDDVALELRKLQAKVNATPIIKERFDVRQSELDRIRGDMVAAGVLRPAQAKNPHYFRHQVLAYAKVKQAAGRGAKVASSSWHSRRGSEKDINANYLQAEAEWMFKAMNDVSTMRFLNWLKGSKYDKKPAMVRQAKASNRSALEEALVADGIKAEHYKEMGQRVAASMQGLQNSIADAPAGQLLKVPEELQGQIQRILDGEGSRIEEGASIFGAVAYFANQSPDPSLQAAASGVLGAVSARKNWVRTEAIPDKYVDPQSVKALLKAFGDDNDAVWQPDAFDGKTRAVHIFTGKSISDHIADRMVDTMAETWEKVMAGEDAAISPEEFQTFVSAIRDTRMIGGPKHEMVLDAGIADTLNEFHDRESMEGFDAILRLITGRWKQWTLFSPRRFMKYILNNRTGDLDALLANPSATGAMKYLRTAFQELRRFHGDGLPTASLLEALDKGVVQSGMTRQEIQSAAEAALAPGGEITIRAFRDSITPVRLARQYFQSIIGLAGLLENTVRYAAYIHYQKPDCYSRARR